MVVLDASGVAKEFMTANEIAQQLNVGYLTALNLMKREMPFLRIGRLYRVRKADFDKWMKREMRV